MDRLFSSAIFELHAILMRQLFLILILLLPIFTIGQFDKAVYRPYLMTADSIVKLYYGKTKFDNYIKLDSSKSEFLELHSFWDNRVYFDKPLNFKPNIFQFQYLFIHPKFYGDTFVISFLLDTNRNLRTGFNPTGLFDCSNKERLDFITRDSALSIAKREKIKPPLTNFEIQIGWESVEGDFQTYKKTNDLRDLVNGRIVWRIKSVFRKAPEDDEDPYAQIFVIDALTGKIISEELPFFEWN